MKLKNLCYYSKIKGQSNILVILHYYNNEVLFQSNLLASNFDWNLKHVWETLHGMPQGNNERLLEKFEQPLFGDTNGIY